MKAKILGILTIAILVASCGTNKGFHKKHHKHRKWIKVGEKTNPDFAAKEEIQTIDNQLEIEKSEAVNPLNGDAVEETPNTRINADKPENKEITSRQESKSSSDLGSVDSPSNVSDDVTISHDIDSSTMPNNTEKAISKKTVKQTIKDGRKDVKEKSTGELLLLALLIVLIIVAFSFLDGLLGGLLGAILIVFLILLLLRYFGII